MNLPPYNIKQAKAPGRCVWITHWLVAGMVLFTLSSGYFMSDTNWNGIGLISRSDLYMVHKSVGALVAPLLIVWLVVRLQGVIRNKFQPFSIVKIFHVTIFIILSVIVLSGWAGSSAGGYNDRIFILSLFPELFAERDIKRSLELYADHKYAVSFLWKLLLLHMVGAIYHYKGDTIARNLIEMKRKYIK